ncbi:hypothetical protein Acr_29g0012280 [Actinidia rufa]|uniref:Uncharacterized protein n=1 Tax=Actinidia rufa TaxID=165716 RepID=A0A7J0HFZ1_9ERIC|nr:hypothetical protein Acr_29g0012280 [Actinidia rufa]
MEVAMEVEDDVFFCRLEQADFSSDQGRRGRAGPSPIVLQSLSRPFQEQCTQLVHSPHFLIRKLSKEKAKELVCSSLSHHHHMWEESTGMEDPSAQPTPSSKGTTLITQEGFKGINPSHNSIKP